MGLWTIEEGKALLTVSAAVGPLVNAAIWQQEYFG